MITVKQMKKTKEELVSAGIPLNYFLQEKRVTLEIDAKQDGEVEENISGEISGFNLGTYHQSGHSFCYSTNGTPEEIAHAVGVINLHSFPQEKVQMA